MAQVPATTSPIIIQSDSRRGNPIVNKILIGGAVIVGIWAGKKFIYDPWRAAQEAKKLGTDPATQAASIIWDAKGFWMDNEQAAVDAAKQVAEKGVPWEDVAKSFSKLHEGRNISDYMDSFMSAEQKTKFFNTLNLTQSSVIDPKTGLPKAIKSEQTWTAGLAVIATANVNVRKTPKVTKTASQIAKDAIINIFSLKDSTKSNVIVTASKDSVIGIATGKTSFDSVAEPSGVLFVEVSVNVVSSTKGGAAASQVKKVTSTSKGKTVNVWVAASQAMPKPLAEITEGKKFTSPYKLFTLTQDVYDKTASVSGIGTVENADFNTQVIADRKKVAILDAKGNQVMTADRGTILGYYIAQEKSTTGKTKFQSAAGFPWFVKTADVRTTRR